MREKLSEFLEKPMDEQILLIAESFMEMAEHASDIAYARRVLYEAYILEGFSEQEALELCKML